MKAFNFMGALALSGTFFLGMNSNAHAAFEPILDPTAIDSTVDPCSDFYSYACGGWLSRTELPGDRPSWTRSFSTINEQNLNELRAILDNYANGDFSLPSHYSKKLGAFYAACMNTTPIEAAQKTILSSELEPVESFKKEELTALIAKLRLRGRPIFFSVGSSSDLKDSTRQIAEIDQGGYSLPSKDYYFDTDKASIREKFVEHVARMFELAGIPKNQTEKSAQSVLAFETALTKNALSPVDRRDPQKLYHILSKGRIKELAPVIQWDSYFDQIGAPSFENLNVAVPDFFSGLNALLNTAPKEQIQAYLKWRVIHSIAPDLGHLFVEENFNFFGKTLSGQKQIKPRWKTCVEATDQSFEDALGEAFVRKTFGDEGKTQTLALVKSIQNVFGKNLASVSWMDPPTREQAIKKLQAIQNKIGFPEKWTDFSAIEIQPDSHIQNRSNLNQFWFQKDLNKIGKPVDRSEWGMSPPTVNAYYDPQKNEIAFPAGILQPPFYQANASLASNYGAIGMVIGHELTHGFDDQGRQFDELGNLKDWWTQEVSQIFDQKAECLVKQYSSYVVIDDIHLNGKLTLGENIADLGGLKIAYTAYRLASDLAKDTRKQEIQTFTADQQFFLSFAQSWCTKRTPEIEKRYAATDPHSSPRYRVNGVVTNLTEFERAFSCTPGAPLAPLNRCSIW